MKSWFLAIWCVFAWCNPALADERILEFFSDIKIERGGDLLVTENLRVRSEGKQIKYGLQRDFPRLYRQPDASRHEVSLVVVSVRRDGRVEPFVLSRLKDGVRLVTGRPGVVFKPGEYQFEITYRISRQIAFSAQAQTLDWDVTGSAWAFPIDKVRARVMLPEEVFISPLAEGAADWGENARVLEQEPGRIVLVSSGNLAPRESMRAALSWPADVVAPPGRIKAAWYDLLDNLAIYIAGAGLAVLLVYYLWACLRTSRWRYKAPAVRLEPPEEMSAPAGRDVYRKVFDTRGFLSGVMELLARRSLRICHKADGSYLERLPNHTGTDGRHDPLLNSILTRFFEGSRELLRLDGLYRRCVGDARQEVGQMLAATYGSTLFVRHERLALRGLYIWIVMAAALVGVAIVHAGGWRAPLALGILLPLPAIPLLFMAFAQWRSAEADLGSVALLLAAGLFLSGGIWVSATNAENLPGLLAALAPLVALPLVLGAFDFLHCYSATGREIRGQIDGFRRYLRHPRAVAQSVLTKEEALERYERYLPYALALDAEKAWAAAFESELRTGGGAALQAMQQRYWDKHDVLTQARRIMGGLKPFPRQ